VREYFEREQLLLRHRYFPAAFQIRFGTSRCYSHSHYLYLKKTNVRGRSQCYQGVHYEAKYEAQMGYFIHLMAFNQHSLFHRYCLIVGLGNFAWLGEDFLFTSEQALEILELFAWLNC
jgi:hypothetical protein